MQVLGEIHVGRANRIADSRQKKGQRDDALLAVDDQRVRDGVRFVVLGQQHHGAEEVRIVRAELVQLENIVEQRRPLAAAPTVGALEIGNDVLFWPIEEWAEALQAKEQEEVWRAARALHVMGAEGRPYLWQGLENPSVHTRRICLENLTVADLRCYGDDGRRRLVTLAGDVEDVRIRERASYYLAQWRYAIPAP